MEFHFTIHFMSRDPDFSYINSNGKKVSGPAAFLHYVYSEAGGIAEYNDEVGEAYISAFVKEHSNNINSGIGKKAKKKRLRAV